MLQLFVGCLACRPTSRQVHHAWATLWTLCIVKACTMYSYSAVTEIACKSCCPWSCKHGAIVHERLLQSLNQSACL